jgi:cellulose synthase/poly-beta-1,6-N-acetylglucosamine synthase-like glycosyltransferase
MTLTCIIALVLAPGWAYLVGAAVAAVRFARHPLPTAVERPPVTVMKPLHGAEPGLYENLRSFAQQDYPVIQLVLGVGNASDGALPTARALIRDLPESDIALVIDGRVRGSQRRSQPLRAMLAARGTSSLRTATCRSTGISRRLPPAARSRNGRRHLLSVRGRDRR